MRGLTRFLAVVIGCSTLSGCGDSLPADTQDIRELFEQSRSSSKRIERPSVSKDQLRTLRNANVDLSFRLLEQVAQEDKNGVVSGVSLQTGMGMVHAMAAGDTQKNITESMKFLPDAADTYAGLNYFDQALADRNLSASKHYEPLVLQQANQVFFRQDMEPGSDFLEILARNFGTGVSMVDFNKDAPATLKKINAWISANTKGEVPSLLTKDEVNEDAQWLLVNALYLNAPWKMEFREPEPKPFTTADGEEFDHPTFIKGSMEASCGKDEDFRWAYLPLRSEELSFLVILPEKGGIQEALKKLSGERLEKMREASKVRMFFLALPRFSVDSGRMNLNQPFKALGMKAPFKEGANFRGHSDGKSNTTRLAQVLQRVVIAVERKGISAGAVSSFDGVAAGVGDEDHRMILNRPFLFAVVDKPTGLALFVGQLADPRR